MLPQLYGRQRKFTSKKEGAGNDDASMNEIRLTPAPVIAKKTSSLSE